MDQDAASPTIGIVMMVAIVVFLGAAVWILLDDIVGEPPGEAVNMAGQGDEQRDRWTVILGPEQPRLEFAIRGEAGVRWVADTDATAANSAAMDGTMQPLSGEAPWAAGGFISLCGDGGAVSSYRLLVLHIQSDQVAASYEFRDIAACS